MFGRNKEQSIKTSEGIEKISSGSSSSPKHVHKVSDNDVKEAAQVLALWISTKGPMTEAEIHLQNFGCVHGKLGDFKVTIEKV